jgi:hypothetical protein
MDILDIVKRECKGLATDDEVMWLSDPSRKPDWCRALGEAISEFESQMLYHKTSVERSADDARVGIISKDDYIAASEKFEAWNRKALRYRSGLITRLSEVKGMMDSDGTIDFKSMYHELANAITQHRIATEDEGLTPEKHDADLWSTLNNH